MVSNRPLQSWLSYLETIHPLSMDFKLARIRTVYERMNLAKIAPLIITVAGTNGKGSTSTTIANLYKASGKKKSGSLHHRILLALTNAFALIY